MFDADRMTRRWVGRHCWIFVSHCHKDLPKVREVRNMLERRHANPLLFFLKCFEDDDALLPELIRREIEARSFFLLCDSAHARASRHVREEHAIVKALPDRRRKFATIDLDRNLEPQVEALDLLIGEGTIFLSCAREDAVIVERVRARLLERDFAVWQDAMGAPDANWSSSVRIELEDSVTRGCFLPLLSPAYLRSDFCRAEWAAATRWATAPPASRILPVRIAEFDASALPPEMRQIQYFDLATGRFEERLEALVDRLMEPPAK